MKNKDILKICFTVIFIYLLYKLINIEDIITLYSKLKINTIITCIFFHFIIYFLRSLRFSVLARTKLRPLQILDIVLVHGLYNRVLPLRLGEGAFPLLMKQKFDISYTESGLLIILARIFDLLSTSTIFAFVCILTIFKNSILKIVLFVIIVIGLAFISMYKLIPLLLNNLSQIRHLQRFSNQLDLLKKYFQENISIKKTLIVFFISGINWFIMFIIFKELINDFNLLIKLMHVVLAGSFSNISSILPLSSIGNFGTMETGWVAILLMVGHEKDQAIISGFSVNVFTFSSTVLLGVIGYSYMKIKRMRMKKNEFR